MRSLIGRTDILLWNHPTGFDATARVRYGLVGSADLIGLRSITITPEMVGQTIGVFVALETKSPTGRPSPEQLAFGDSVERIGGLYRVTRSLDEVKEVIG